MGAVKKVSVEEAAYLLGVSGQTVRRRIERGELRAEKVTTVIGQMWQVEIEMPESNSEPIEHVSVGASNQEADALARAMYRDLLAHLSELQRTALIQAEEIGRLRAQLAEAQVRLEKLAERR